MRADSAFGDDGEAASGAAFARGQRQPPRNGQVIKPWPAGKHRNDRTERKPFPAVGYVRNLNSINDRIVANGMCAGYGSFAH